MEYRSPIPVLKYAGADITKPIDTATLLKIQKRLLVELELTGSNSLTIGEQSFTKDDILSLIDSVKETDQIVFHEWIYENPSLLSLLTRGTEGDGVLFSTSLLYRRQYVDFKGFVSPYLTQPLGKALNQAFLKRDFARAGRLMGGRDLITDVFYDETFGKLKHSLKSLAGEVKQNEQNPSAFDPKHFTFITNDFIAFLNNLPDDFVTLREQLVVNLINLSVMIQKNEVTFCLELYSRLVMVKCSEGTYQTILKNFKVFQGKGKGAPKGSITTSTDEKDKKTGRGCLTLFFYSLIVFVIVRTCVSTCSNNSERNNSAPSLSNSVVSLSESDLKMMMLKENLKKVTISQIKSDSLAKVWATHPELPQQEAWPFPKLCRNMKDYAPTGERSKISLTNLSEYDAVVFIVDKTAIYAASVSQRKTLDAWIAPGDKISFYIGKQWDLYAWFKYRPFFDARVVTESGLFAKTDSTTLLHLDTYFECKRVDTRNSLPVTLQVTSPFKDSFRFVYAEGLFEMKQVSDVAAEKVEESTVVEEVAPAEAMPATVAEPMPAIETKERDSVLRQEPAKNHRRPR